MRAQGEPQAIAATSDQPLGSAHVTDQPAQQVGRWPLDEPFPAVLRDIDFIRALGCSSDHFYRRKARREFACFELDSPYAGRTEYSGQLVATWLQTGERPRRFFKGAVRAAVVRTGKPGRPRKLRAVEGHREGSR